jgi:flavin reductase (DIM6/NTAB) family NADH-FMN oxidoreductase RutF
MKIEVPLSKALRLINPGPVVLVTSEYEETVNIMAAAWTTPISHDPPLVGVSISPRRFTHELIEQSGEFALNVPGLNLARQVKLCGTRSGRNVDKFREAHLTPVEAKVVSGPLIEECLAHLECTLVEHYSLGDHTLFIGRVVAAQAEAGTFSETWLLDDEEIKPLHHLGGTYYGVLGARIRV